MGYAFERVANKIYAEDNSPKLVYRHQLLIEVGNERVFIKSWGRFQKKALLISIYNPLVLLGGAGALYIKFLDDHYAQYAVIESVIIEKRKKFWNIEEYELEDTNFDY